MCLLHLCSHPPSHTLSPAVLSCAEWPLTWQPSSTTCLSLPIPSASFLLPLLLYMTPFLHCFSLPISQEVSASGEKRINFTQGSQPYSRVFLCQAIWLETAELDEKSQPYTGVLKLPLPHVPIAAFWINKPLFQSINAL